MGPLPNRGFRLLYTLYANILRRGHGHDCLDDRLHRRRLLGRQSRRRHAECTLRGFGGRADALFLWTEGLLMSNVGERETTFFAQGQVFVAHWQLLILP